jgi:hypothetical protein
MTTRAFTAAAVAVLTITGFGPASAGAAGAGGDASSGGASAPTGGTTSGGPGGGSTSGGPAATSPQPLGPVVWVGRTVTLPGNLGPSAAGQTVLVERLSPSHGRWVATARTRADDQGSFTVSWRATEAGHLAFRARVASLRAGSAQADPSTPANLIGNVTVYRSDLATWFGPGSYGRRTACGQQMTGWWGWPAGPCPAERWSSSLTGE